MILCKHCLVPPSCIFEEPVEGFMPTLSVTYQCPQCKASVSSAILLDMEPGLRTNKQTPLMVLAIRAQTWVDLVAQTKNNWIKEFGKVEA